MTAARPTAVAAGVLPAEHALQRRRDLAVAAIALVLLLAWDASGWDLAVMQLFGDTHGFGWRDSFLASRVMHDGGRLLAAAVLAVLAAHALRAPAAAGPGRAERWHWIGVVLLCLVAVPALKRYSSTSCPWDLAEFGGHARYVSHWAFGVAGGGPGHCFPSGHAVAAFAFLGLHFQWRAHAPARARAWLAAVLLAGLAFGAAQLVRGAHYPSHTLWSAWLCWVLCALADAAMPARRLR